MALTLQCPHFFSISGIQYGCMLGKSCNCETCDCPDKYYVDTKITSSFATLDSKTMTQEEKAKAYDEAKLRMSAAYNSNRCTIGFMHEIFPKLKESEDEKVRKVLLDYFKDYKTQEEISKSLSTFFGIPTDNIIAWLEKQGEQKSVNKVEPKFHKGQWIVWQDKCYKVNYNGCGYELIDQNGLRTSLEYGTVDKSAHLWTIDDAKKGDVLVNWNNTATPSTKLSHLGLPEPQFGLQPATKEERDLLFQKMKESGYEWDADKKELKLLISNGGDFDSKNCEQKPAWSEEDEEMCQETIDWFEKKCFPYALENDNPARESITWLKSIKQRMGG